jgi:anhydro-N-acetylmuramic acid kinase
MTGTSCDAIDISIIAFSAGHGQGERLRWRVLSNDSASYPADLRKAVLAVQSPGTRVTLQQLLGLERQVGTTIGKAVARVLKNTDAPTLDAVAIHGQTIAHHPAPSCEKGVGGLTLQIGSPEAVALATGSTVISHFRDGDIIVGGQGAPLVPRFHRDWVLNHLGPGALRRGIAIHNIGGMSNLTYLGPKDCVLAFDSGPGNAWIDEAARHATHGRKNYDQNGKMAATAEPDRLIVSRLLRDPFLRKRPPKSTGRDDFPFEKVVSAFGKTCPSSAVLVSTATEFTAASIEDAYLRYIFKKGHPLSKILVCGGGALNPELMRRIRQRMYRHGVAVETLGQHPSASMDADPQFIEAQAFALFGMRCLQGVPIGGSWTGAKSYAPPGRITPGLNFKTLLSKISPSK